MPNRCDICPAEFAPIPGDGPKPCGTVLIGERPGDKENKRGRVFCGPTGEELDRTYLPLAGLHREDVYVTNATKCFAVGNRAPGEKEVLGCGRCFLPRELDACQPEIVVLLGGSACRLIDRTEAQGRVRIDYAHGRPMRGSLLDGAWEGWIWPSYHPALGLHDTTKMTPLLEDFRRLGEWMRGEWEPPQPAPDEAKDYRLISTPEEVDRYILMPLIFGIQPREIAIDTESHGPREFSLQMSNIPHTGRMVLAESTAAIERVGWHIERHNIEVIMHHALHDLDDLARMGVRVGRFRDTLQELFQHGALPQGLKPAAYRLLGVEMTSWEDTVLPASTEALVTWLMNAADLSAQLVEVKTTALATWRCLDCSHKQHDDKLVCGSKAGGGRCLCVTTGRTSNLKHEHRVGATETVLRHVLHHTTAKQTGDEPYEPWKKLKEMRAEGLRGRVPESWEFEWLERELGPMPILGIGNCSMEQAIEYSVGDADMTLQVARVLKERRGDRRYAIDPSDKDI
jgi:uracil-DNA glycosylase